MFQATTTDRKWVGFVYYDSNFCWFVWGLNSIEGNIWVDFMHSFEVIIFAMICFCITEIIWYQPELPFAQSTKTLFFSLFDDTNRNISWVATIWPPADMNLNSLIDFRILNLNTLSACNGKLCIVDRYTFSGFLTNYRSLLHWSDINYVRINPLSP